MTQCDYCKSWQLCPTRDTDPVTEEYFYYYVCFDCDSVTEGLTAKQWNFKRNQSVPIDWEGKNKK